MRETLNKTTVAPPIPVLVVSGVVLSATSVVAFLGAVTVGVTWDEGAHVNILRTYFESGWYTAAPLINGIPDPAFYFGTYVYGPMGEIIPHLVNVLTGEESLFATVSDSAMAYQGRHIGIAIQGLIGIFAVGSTVGLVTRSWKWGVLGAALLSAVPLWTGHSMFNLKDIPPATGYALFTMGLVALLDQRYLTDRRVRLTALLGITSGLVLAIGGRTGLTILFISALPLSFLFTWISSFRARSPLHAEMRLTRKFFEGIAAYLFAYLILVAFYPKAFLNPVEVGIKSLLDSALFPMIEAQLTNGVWMVQPVAWTYQPLWLGAQLPVLVLLFGLLYVLWWVVRVMTQFVSGSSDNATSYQLSQTTPLLIQAFAAPTAAIIGSSTLYNGTRQILFVVPAITVLSVLGIREIAILVQESMRNWLRRIFWGGIVVGLVVPVLGQVQLFPYSYTYFNALASLQPIDERWPTDYWRASGRELLRLTPAGGRDSCGYEQLQKGQLFPCTEQPMFTPFLGQRGVEARPFTLQDHEYWFIRGNHGILNMPPGCRLYNSLKRPLLWQKITIGQIAICDDRVDTGVLNMIDPSQPIASTP